MVPEKLKSDLIVFIKFIQAAVFECAPDTSGRHVSANEFQLANREETCMKYCLSLTDHNIEMETQLHYDRLCEHRVKKLNIGEIYLQSKGSQHI